MTLPTSAGQRLTSKLQTQVPPALGGCSGHFAEGNEWRPRGGDGPFTDQVSRAQSGDLFLLLTPDNSPIGRLYSSLVDEEMKVWAFKLGASSKVKQEGTHPWASLALPGAEPKHGARAVGPPHHTPHLSPSSAPFLPADVPALGLTFDSGLATSLSTSPPHCGPLFHHLLHPRLTSLQAYTLPVLTHSSAHSMNTHHFYPELTVSTGLQRRDAWLGRPEGAGMDRKP